MDTTMATGVFRLKGRQLYGKAIGERKVRNIQDVSDRIEGMTYTTVHRWITNPGELTGIDFDNLTEFLVDGLGLTPEQITRMSFGEIFEFVPEKESR